MPFWPGCFINPIYSKLLAIFVKTLGFFEEDGMKPWFKVDVFPVCTAQAFDHLLDQIRKEPVDEMCV